MYGRELFSPFLIFCLCFEDGTYSNNVTEILLPKKVGPDLDPYCLTLRVSDGIPERIFEKVSYKKISRKQKHPKFLCL